MIMKWIVLLNGFGEPLLLSDDDGKGLLFDSREDAEKAVSHNDLGLSRGYVVMEWAFSK